MKYKKGEIERYNEKCENINRDNELLKVKIFDLEKLLNEAREVENKVYILDEENNRLKAHLEEKRNRLIEVEKRASKIVEFEHRLRVQQLELDKTKVPL